MSTTVTYKGDVITTVDNETKTLATAGKYLEGNVAITDVSSGSGGVKEKRQISFYDYDGTLVDSYTAEEWANVTALPDNPSHDGLTAQGWNWTKAQIDSQLSDMPQGNINVGQMYITDDGKTRIYIHLEKGRTDPYLGFCPKGTVYINWGDGSEETEVTGSSISTTLFNQHIYSSEGDYIITIRAKNDATYAFKGGNSYGSYILRKTASTSAAANPNRVFLNAITKVEFGTGARLNDYGFQYCTSLETVTLPTDIFPSWSTPISVFEYCHALKHATLPSGISYINSNLFYYCHSLKTVSLSPEVTTISGSVFYCCYSLYEVALSKNTITCSDSAFRYCYALKRMILPNNLRSLGSYAFGNCPSLEELTIPSGVTTISTYLCSNCSSLREVTILGNLTTIGNYAFQYCSALRKITILGNLTSIGNYVFTYNYALSEFTVPSTVTSIGRSDFNGCGGIKSYYLCPITPPTLSNTDVFTGIQSDCIIYVPVGSLEAYQTANNWSTYASYMREGIETV